MVSSGDKCYEENTIKWWGWKGLVQSPLDWVHPEEMRVQDQQGTSQVNWWFPTCLIHAPLFPADSLSDQLPMGFGQEEPLAGGGRVGALFLLLFHSYGLSLCRQVGTEGSHDYSFCGVALLHVPALSPSPSGLTSSNGLTLLLLSRFLTFHSHSPKH